VDALQFFALHHEDLWRVVHRDLLSGLSDAQLRFRPQGGLNSIAWLTWHMARGEDLAMNVILAGRPQVIDETWLSRLNLSRRDIGTGMTDDEVSDFSQRVNLSAVRDYCIAVAQRTREVVASLRAECLTEVPDPDQLSQLLADAGALGPNAGWVAESFRGRTKAMWLGHFGLTHSWRHRGEGLSVRGLLGMPTR
jgi:hypothetical protein